MKKAEEYVRETQPKVALDAADLEIWQQTIEAAQSEALAEGLQLSYDIADLQPPSALLRADLVEGEKSETYKLFEFEHGTVQYWEQLSPATRKILPRLYVQIIDQYRWQREWALQLKHVAGDSGRLHWESHVYRHPGVRCIVNPTPAVAQKLLAKFMEYCETYPTLLFNPADERRARHEGFVHFAEALHQGCVPTAQML